MQDVVPSGDLCMHPPPTSPHWLRSYTNDTIRTQDPIPVHCDNQRDEYPMCVKERDRRSQRRPTAQAYKSKAYHKVCVCSPLLWNFDHHIGRVTYYIMRTSARHFRLISRSKETYVASSVLRTRMNETRREGPRHPRDTLTSTKFQ